MLKIFPNVKQMVMLENDYLLKKEFTVFFQSKMVNVFRALKEAVKFSAGFENEADIRYLSDSSLGNEAYVIKIDTHFITINYGSEAGAFYATLSLRQIMKQSTEKIRCCFISDKPDLRIRGFMLDISRDKVPTCETIKNIIVLMSNLKMNHLELYVEGFSFGYPSFSRYLEADGFISVAEYQEIEKFANERYVDLVPNQNGFGHMAKWLEKDEFKDLAEKPDGIFLWGRHRQPSTLDPLNPGSLELVKKLYADMLPISSSPFFNMNFDEPFELGKGHSKEICDKIGLGNVYVDFVLKACEEVKKYHKTPMIWGDVLISHPELLDRLPKDMLFLDWGYDANYPFSDHLKKLHELKIKFIAAPGTTSWCSFLGRKDDWEENITNACVNAKRFEGEGMILTDWGDFGHLQFWPASWAPLVFGALMSWRVKEGTAFILKDYLNSEVFRDEAGIMADAVMDLGNHYHYLNEYRSNATQIFYGFMMAVQAVTEENPIVFFQSRIAPIILTDEKNTFLGEFLDQKVREIHNACLRINDGEIVKAEFIQSVRLVKTVLELNQCFSPKLKESERIKKLTNIIMSQPTLIEEQKRLWLARNKSGGLNSSLAYLEKFFKFAAMAIKYYQRGEIHGA